jgi:Family of unknown function (DUF5677)
MTEDAEVIATVREVLAVFRRIVESVSTLRHWTRQVGGWWTVLLRCVLLHQYESLETVVDLVERGRGESCIPLLRSGCEEYLWIKFLKIIEDKRREVILQAKAAIELDDSIQAQRKYIGDAGLLDIGISGEIVESIRKSRVLSQLAMKDIGTHLGWKLKRRLFPTTAYIANAVGEKELYDLIFHATSRTVHFSVSELFRRAWGDEEELRITSKDMNRYWSRFALFWGTRVLALTAAEILDEFGDHESEWPMTDLAELDPHTVEQMLRKISESGYVQIITAEELNQHIPPEKRPNW